jgi:ribosomal protein S8
MYHIMSQLKIASNLLNLSVLQRRSVLILKYNKILKIFLEFLVQEGFLLRVIFLEKILKVFLKYYNGISVFKRLIILTKKTQNIFLSYEQLVIVVKKNPNFFFVIYVDGKFLLHYAVLKQKKGGWLLGFLF